MDLRRKNVQGQRVDVTLHRDGLSAPWGFRLHGGVDFDSPLLVQKVAPLGASDGYLKKGDLITRIDGYDAFGCTHNVALKLIANAGSTITLSLLRPDRRYDNQRTGNDVGAVNDIRVRFADELSFKEKDASSSHRLTKKVFNTKDEEEEKRLATDQAKKLAGIMKESLQNRPAQKPRKISDSSKTSVDLTSYLPHMPPKRSCGPKQPQSMAIVSPPSEIRNQIKDTLLHGCSPGVSSGRSTPSTSSVIELGSPADRNRPMGVWVPPTQHPNSKLVHLQYNSPLGIYSAYNVADSVEKMTGSKVEWLNQPPSAKYLDDIRDSATYKFVQELEGRRPSGNHGKTFEQSATLKNMSRYFGVDS